MKPEDISQEAWNRAYCHAEETTTELGPYAFKDVRRVVAEAIVAAEKRGEEREREACAAHLESEAKASPLGHENVQRGRSTYNWLAHCARLIRNRSTHP